MSIPSLLIFFAKYCLNKKYSKNRKSIYRTKNHCNFEISCKNCHKNMQQLALIQNAHNVSN